MAASYGTPTPTTIRAAGPSPEALVDRTALGNVVFEPTAEGMQVMAITFPAALGPMYATYFHTAIDAKDFDLHTAQHVRRSPKAYTTSSSRRCTSTSA